MNRERNARLARAMGWRWVSKKFPTLDGSGVWLRYFVDPSYTLPDHQDYRLARGEEEIFHDGQTQPPDFQADTPEGHWWKAKLLEWLAGQDTLVKRKFRSSLEDGFHARMIGVEIVKSMMYLGHGLDEHDLLIVMLATPAQVAEAADRAIGEVEEKK
jgi:hypothetical protein